MTVCDCADYPTYDELHEVGAAVLRAQLAEAYARGFAEGMADGLVLGAEGAMAATTQPATEPRWQHKDVVGCLLRRGWELVPDGMWLPGPFSIRIPACDVIAAHGTPEEEADRLARRALLDYLSR